MNGRYSGFANPIERVSVNGVEKVGETQHEQIKTSDGILATTIFRCRKKIGYKIARIYECLLLQCTLVAPNKGHEIYCNARDLISSLNNESCSFEIRD